MKNILIVLLACSTALLATVNLRRTAAARPVANAVDLSSASTASPAVTVATAQEPERIIPVSAALQAENAELQKHIRNLESEVSILNARRTPAPSTGPAMGTLPSGNQRLLAEMLGNEKTVGLAMAWIKADQSRRFLSLIKLTGLDPTQEEQLRTLLAERYATRLDLAAAGLEAITPAQRQQFDADHQARLEQLVGKEMSALFDKAELKPVSFARMQALEDRLRYDAEPLNREQYLPLWNLLSSQVFYGSGAGTEAGIQSNLQRITRGTATILAESRALLKPAQYATLEALLNDDLARARVDAYRAQQRLRAPLSANSSPPTSQSAAAP